MLESLFSKIRSRNRQFTVYAAQKTDSEGLFANHNVDVVHRDIPAGGPEPFLVLEENGKFVGAIALADLEGLLEPPLVRPGEREDLSAGYRVLFDVLDEQVFTALERSQLLAVSREIEDLAFRIGSGELRVAFQTRPALEAQIDVYRHLARETDLDIHVYVGTDWTPLSIPNVTYHEFPAETLDRYWVLAFDGGTDHTSGLVGQEQPDGYDGFWADDAEIVDEILATLRQV